MTYKDERIEQAKQKIGSEMMQLTFYGVVISFLVKVLYFHYGLEQCILECFIIFFIPFYQIIRCHQLGVVLSAFPKPTLKNTLPALVTGALVMIFVIQDKEHISAIAGIISFCISVILARFGFYHLEKRRKEKLEKEYDE